VTDFLLFLHVLAAFMLAGTTVMVSAVALGATAPERTIRVSNLLWDIGGIGTLVFGVWLAIDIDGYDVFDGWIILALVLWALATEAGRRAREEVVPWHWVRAVLVLCLLLDMIFKPGA
jgi:hypothetical protein